MNNFKILDKYLSERDRLLLDPMDGDRPNRLYIGVDPGVSGAVCVLDSSLSIMSLFDMPFDTVILKTKGKKRKNGKRSNLERNWVSPEKLLQSMRAYSPLNGVRPIAIIEKQLALPFEKIQGVATIFDGYGTLRSTLSFLGIPTLEVDAKDWQSIVLNEMLGNDTKQRSRAFSGQRYPGVDLGPDKGGRADAICIAIFASILDSMR